MNNKKSKIGNIPLSAFVLSAEGQCAEDIKLTKGYTFSGKYFTKDNSIADVLNTLLSAERPPYEENNPLFFISNSSTAYVMFYEPYNKTYSDVKLEYSEDEKKTWKQYQFNEDSSKNEKIYLTNCVYFRCPNDINGSQLAPRLSTSSGNNIEAHGNIMSIIANDYADKIDIEDENCFYGWAQNCTSLSRAPRLPATTLTYSCYTSMFEGCTSLTAAPELPATTLAEGCYDSMFQNCTSLTAAPELPATTLYDSCYDSMFYGCTSLTAAPYLPTIQLTENCYNNMFNGCSSLSSIHVNFASWNDGLENWLYGVAENGIISCSEDISTYASGHIPVSWTIQSFTPAIKQEPVCFQSNDNNAWVSFRMHDDQYYNRLEYSRNKNDWTEYDFEEEVSLSSKVYFRCPAGHSNLVAPFLNLPNDTAVSATGSIMTLLTKNGSLTVQTQYIDNQYGTFGKFAEECTSLVQAPELPATALTNLCYRQMFYNCTSLTSAPELPATTLANDCYCQMFESCTSLTVAPKLPTTTLADYCYSYMFYGCTSLTAAPELPATTLARSCYSQMFDGCTSLTEVNVKFTNWSNDTTYSWLSNVKENGIFRCPQTLIDATTTRSATTVPKSWRMESNG